MSAWSVLIGKELLEMKRNYKLLWVPLVFLILGLMQPITTYYLPEILQASGDMPEGFVFPKPEAADVMVKTLSNLGTIGMLVLVLAVMGTVSAERQSGMTGMILVKPVPDAAYLLSKWASAVLLVWAAVLPASLGAWYYTSELVGDVDAGRAAGSALLYGLWLSLIVTFTVLMSTWLKSGGAAAALSLLLASVLSMAASLIPGWMEWNPARLTDHAASLLKTGKTAEGLALSLPLAFLLMAGFLALAVYLFRNKETKAS